MANRRLVSASYTKFHSFQELRGTDQQKRRGTDQQKRRGTGPADQTGPAVIILDGGLGTHLADRGNDISDSLWSARILRDNPDEVRAAHADFFRAGAQVASTCSYQVTFDGLAKAGASRVETEELLRASVRLAREAAEAVPEVHEVSLGEGLWSERDSPQTKQTNRTKQTKQTKQTNRTPTKVREEAAHDSRSNETPSQLLPPILPSTNRPDSSRAAISPRLVAASVGPYGAGPGQGTEYDGAYGLTAAELAAWHRPRLEILANTDADFLLAETIPSILEVEALTSEFAQLDKPAILSITVADGKLRDGSSLEDVAAIVRGSQLAGLGINCCTTADALTALRILAPLSGLPLTAYPNSGESWDRVARQWVGNEDELSLVNSVPELIKAGARMIGGCCRVTPQHIAAIVAHTQGWQK